ncbi:hypothetical protein HGO34_07710 [Agrobacterium vitis]|uniref:Uncharacterized protein n=1 Tax=Agrobacterium vitis TaxID=373 RepID=A0AAE4WCL9_AGRVI|nr:hypothetical protein [Agrobacterium vitis]MCF1501499.1 hypothetical protein [Allorhizobium sp. Av2]MCM2439601.1 hypothetical protein [Agrobacterium vitis]MUZ57500.1 hypothetical protein [Agrobacterium vitis]MVA68800.1 hypothetical protein [Agrobacterium vitis]MVA87916.1 hypothetical protein [Agrobacterium vitis]
MNKICDAGQFFGKGIGRNSIKYFENRNDWRCQAFIDENEQAFPRPLTPMVSAVPHAPREGRAAAIAHLAVSISCPRFAERAAACPIILQGRFNPREFAAEFKLRK